MDYKVSLPITSHFYIHFSGCALIRPTCSESVIRMMDKQRRFRTSSLGTTVGHGDYAAGDMGQDYTDEVVVEGGGEEGWSFVREGGAILRSRQASITPHGSQEEEFGESWAGSHGGWGKKESARSPLPSVHCGFYWYKNMSLFRHKATPPQVLAEYESVRERLVALCRDTDGQLTDMCDWVLATNCADIVT